MVNAIEKVGYTVEWIKTPEDVEKAEVSYAHLPHAMLRFNGRAVRTT